MSYVWMALIGFIASAIGAIVLLHRRQAQGAGRFGLNAHTLGPG
jgi:hypothetical protein